MDQKERSSHLIPGAILAAGVIIALAIIYSSGSGIGRGKTGEDSGNTQTAAVGGSKEAQTLLEVQDGDFVLGNPSAPVTFVEFGDFQCPFCGRFYRTVEKQLIEKYVKTGQVAFIWRDFAFLGQESFDAAVASRCAGEQGKFWNYHDYLFENQRGENERAFSVANLKKFASNLGLDASKFNECLDSNKFLPAVEAETAFGRELGVSGTPASFINGRLITGALPLASFEALIQEALNNK